MFRGHRQLTKIRRTNFRVHSHFVTIRCLIVGKWAIRVRLKTASTKRPHCNAYNKVSPERYVTLLARPRVLPPSELRCICAVLQTTTTTLNVQNVHIKILTKRSLQEVSKRITVAYIEVRNFHCLKCIRLSSR